MSLVNVDVTVTGHRGAVRGLTRSDFEVLEDGVPQPITNFYAVEHKPTPKSQAKNAEPPSDDDRFRRHVLLLIDNAHMTRFNRDQALASLEKFIDAHFKGGEYDWSIATVRGGTRLLLPQTSDKAAIHTALNTIRRAAARGFEVTDLRGKVVAITPTDQVDDSDTSKDALAEIDIREGLYDASPVQRAIVSAVRAFAGTPGKKVVLIVSGDIGLHDTGNPEVDRDMATLRNAIVREANAANVNLYILNSEGLSSSGLSMERTNRGFALVRPTVDSGYMYWVARETGGRYLGGNYTDVSMRQFDEASSNFYSLAYRPPTPDDHRYHRITVRVKNCSECELRYRDGYTTLSREVEIARALRTPLSASLQGSTLPVTVKAGRVVSTRDGVTIPLEARVPLKELQFVPGEKGWQALVDVYVSIFDEDGRNLALRRFTTTATAPGATAEGDLIHDATVRFGVGKPHTIVVAVRDATNDAMGVWQQTVGF